MAAIPITNVTELQNIVMTGTKSYYLANDIDASDTINWNAGAGFNPIICPGDAIITFDGRGFKIKDLYINRPSTDWVGLFADYGATMNVRALMLDNVYVEGREYVGGLFDNPYTSGLSIDSCGVTGNVVANYYYAGGICGYNSGIITKCYSGTHVWNKQWGHSYGSLVGRNDSTITDCYAIGSAANYYSTKLNTGGLVGENLGTINRCYSIGKVLPIQGMGDRINGFVGVNSFGTILASYWDIETSGYTIGTNPNTDPPTGKTTAQMKQEATFAGWDFKRTWKIIEGASYPRLRIGATKKRATKR